jgi:putative flavoprotein involved in K+ transport
VSRHRRVPRRFLGRDVFTWLVEIGLMNRTRADWVDGRMPPTVLVTGVGGGHDMNLRQLEQQGAAAARHPARRHGRSGESGRRRGADTDRRRHHVRPDRYPTTLSIRKAGITSVIWSIGYSYDYDWVHAPCLDSSGQPPQQRSVGQVHGLYFLGLHWMHTFKSGTFLGIGDDATYVVEHLETHALRH